MAAEGGGAVAAEGGGAVTAEGGGAVGGRVAAAPFPSSSFPSDDSSSRS